MTGHEILIHLEPLSLCAVAEDSGALRALVDQYFAEPGRDHDFTDLLVILRHRAAHGLRNERAAFSIVIDRLMKGAL